MASKLIGLDEIRTLAFWRAVVAEFIATLIFLIVVTTSCVSALSVWGAGQPPAATVVHIGLAIGLAIATLAQCIGHVSGGHINPAVTFAQVALGKCSILKGLFFILAQLSGATAGSAITYGLTPDDHRQNIGATLLGDGVTAGQGFGIELFLTFILVFTVFAVTDPGKKVEPYGTTLAIGISILVCHLGGVRYTGCGINPARSFGPALVLGKWQDHWVYWIGPFVGAALAGVCYELLFSTTCCSKKKSYTEETAEMTGEQNCNEA